MRLSRNSKNKALVSASIHITALREAGHVWDARHTLDAWGVRECRKELVGTCETIAWGDAMKQVFAKGYPDLPVTKYRRHFVFFVRKSRAPVLIVGVIHEKRDVPEGTCQVDSASA